MKKLLFIITLFTTINIYSQCEGTIVSYYFSDPDIGAFRYVTPILRNGTPTYPITPSSSYSVYKFEIIKPDGSIYETININPDEYDWQESNGNYLYKFKSFNELYDGSDICDELDWLNQSPGVSARLTIINYIPWYFGGILQGDYTQGLVNPTCGPDAHIRFSVCGVGSNNNNSDLPNLTQSDFTVEVDGTTYNTFGGTTDNVPTLKYGKEHTFDITIENDEDFVASTSPYEILVSTSDEHPFDDTTGATYHTLRNDNAGNISANSEESDSFSLYVYDNLVGMYLEDNTDYYMHFFMDPNDVVDESNENQNDNWKNIKFKYENSSGRISLNTTSNPNSGFKIPYDYLPNSSPTNVKLYQIINGNTLTVINTNITDQFANIDISSLSAGKYIIHVNGRFERTIKILKGGLQLLGN
jgi:hypothetical protein